MNGNEPQLAALRVNTRWETRTSFHGYSYVRWWFDAEADGFSMSEEGYTSSAWRAKRKMRRLQRRARRQWRASK